MLRIKYGLHQIFNGNPIYRHGLLLLTPLLLSGFLAWAIIVKQQEILHEQQLIYKRLSMTLLQQKQDIKKITQYEQQKQQLEQKWQMLQKSWLSVDQKNVLWSDIEVIAKQSQVSLNHIVVNEMITITIKSDYKQLLNFLELLMEYPYWLLNDLQIKREQKWMSTVLNLHLLQAKNDT